MVCMLARPPETYLLNYRHNTQTSHPDIFGRWFPWRSTGGRARAHAQREHRTGASDIVLLAFCDFIVQIVPTFFMGKNLALLKP